MRLTHPNPFLGREGLFLPTPEATHQAGRSLAPHILPGDIIALSGDLGAGKTSFARGLLAGLGLTEEAPSPSFSLVIPYEPPLVRLPAWHVDLYRLEEPHEAEELGLDEALYDSVLLIEWPERLGDRLWPHALRLRFEPESTGRRLTASIPPSWESRWPFP